jgi:hypothetical protein
MNKKLVRVFDVFVILIILMAQPGFVSGIVLEASAAPAQDTILTNPSFAGVTISNVKINGGDNTGYVTADGTFSLSMDYSIVDADCPGCIDEIEIGFSTENTPFSCIYSGIPGGQGTSGSATIEVMAPSTRFRLVEWGAGCQPHYCQRCHSDPGC